MKNITKKKILIMSISMLAIPLISFAALTNPLGTTNINSVIARIITALLGITGSVALLMFVWGGFQWLVSAGKPEKIQKGKDTLIWAAIGLAVIFGAYTLVNVVVSALEKGTAV
jgi:hypothetical protein